MLVQRSKNTAPSATLIEPEIPDRTQPVLPSGEWGINLAAAQGVFPDKGLQVHIAAWSEMGKGDKVELLFNGNRVDQHSISEDTEVGQRSTLFVAPRHLQTGSHTLSYRVTRPLQGPESQTPPVKIYVKLEIPGGQDTDPLPGHSELFMYIKPEIVNGIVDKETAEQGVPIIIRARSGTGVPYPDAAVDDVIVLSWGGVYLESAPLTALQISDPANHPIEILVTQETIEKAGDTDDSGLAVTFQVRDKVANYSEDWCKETRIVVSTGTNPLLAPIVEETVNNVLDLDALGDKDITVQVWATHPQFKLGDIIILKMRGITQDGETVEVTAPEESVNDLPHAYKLTLLNADVRKLAKTQVIFSYELKRNGSNDPLRSKGQFVQVEGEPTRLAAPIAEDEQQGAIDPDLPDTRIQIPFDPLIEFGMAIELKWFGTRPNGSTYDPELDWFFPNVDEVTDADGFFITVEGQHLKTLEGGTLDLSYNLLSEGENEEIVSRGSQPAAALNVGEPQFELVKPVVLGEEGGALEPSDLPNGVGRLTLPRPTAVPTQAKDVVTYTWLGAVTGKKEDSITLNALSKDKDVNFTLNAAFVAEHIEPNRGSKVTVSYRILRYETGKTSYSNPLEFVIGEAIDSGPLKIMGARYNRSTYRAYGASRVLSAFSETTGQPLQAQWKYPSDTDWTTAATWRDTAPQKPLQVRYADDQVTLNPANIIGNGRNSFPEGLAAFVAHRDVGDVVGWGLDAYGATIPSPIITLDDIVEVSCTRSAYAARRANGAVVVWGNSAEGGSMAGVSPLDFDEVIGSARAFAGIKNTGHVVVWGAGSTETVPAPISTLTDIVRVVAADYAFAALRATGQVVAWGVADYGGTVPKEIAELTDIQTLIGSIYGFAAHRANGRIVAWGRAGFGGDVPDVIAAMTDIIELSCANEGALTARRATGQVVAWGRENFGGTLDPLIGGLTDIVEVTSNHSAFAARRGNGQVVAWGMAKYGGIIDPLIGELTDIVQVCGSFRAFAALRKNGTVVAWGDPILGGDTSTVVSELNNVRALYANTNGFTALTSDGRVVTWGHPLAGGDSSAVQDRLAGKVSYQASPGSRGRA